MIYEFLNQAKAKKVSQALAISFIRTDFRFLKSLANLYPYKLQLQPLNNANAIASLGTFRDSSYTRFHKIEKKQHQINIFNSFPIKWHTVHGNVQLN